VNLGALALKNKISTLVFVFLILVGGILAYRGLSRLEDPEFTIKDALIITPVAITALTTVLGMIPLLPDVFFVSMAVTIMGGLAFATLLTLLVVPVLYAVMFRIPSARLQPRPAPLAQPAVAERPA
jgi:multidrug efflux pump subunit AcrB